MNNILKPFVALATRFKSDEFQRATLKLTLYYVLSTAVILLVSSVAILITFAPPEMELPFRPETAKQDEIEHDEWSLYEVREHLTSVIVVVDFLILLLVSIFAYYFARKTLLPIQEMHKKQQQFLGDVAHELRTPLSVMRAGADTILSRERAAPEYKVFVTDVQEEAARLTRVSNQLLQMLKAGEIETDLSKEVKISELLANEIRRFTPYVAERGITLTSDITPDIISCTHQDALIEVVQNLLKNAIDYSNKGDAVTVSLRTTPTSLDIIVADTGVGIEQSKQVVIFDRFKKIDRARTQTNDSGTGLGLAIVKALVSKLGGQLALKSELGVGTAVTVSLPMRHS